MFFKKVSFVVTVFLVILIIGHVYAQDFQLKNLPDSSIVGSMPTINIPGVQDKIEDAEFKQQVEDIIFTKINAERSKRGITPLKRDNKLGEFALKYDNTNYDRQEIDKEINAYIYSIGLPYTILYIKNLMPNHWGGGLCDNVPHFVSGTVEAMTDDLINEVINNEKCSNQENCFDSKFSIVGLAIGHKWGGYSYYGVHYYSYNVYICCA